VDKNGPTIWATLVILKHLPRVNKGENSPNLVTLVKSMIVVKGFYTEKDFSVVRPTLRHTTKIRRFSSWIIQPDLSRTTENIISCKHPLGNWGTTMFQR
jgi:hypothetical protein